MRREKEMPILNMDHLAMFSVYNLAMDIRLVYVQAKLNGKSMVVMVDSGANHHFIREDIMQMLRLQPDPMYKTFKDVNSIIESIVGVTNDVSLKLGDWSIFTSFIIFPI